MTALDTVRGGLRWLLAPPLHRRPLGGHWSSPAAAPEREPLAEARQALQAIAGRPHAPPVEKGHPDIGALQRTLAQRLLLQIDQPVPPPGLLERSRQLATLDPSDATAFAAHLALLRHLNREALAAARRALSAEVVLHIGCQPRLDRARASCSSFAPAGDAGITQLIVVGGEGEACRFDPAAQLLTVPAPDVYEHLPSKVVAAMAFLALTGTVDAVLKVDDDHRLADAAALRAAFARARRDRRPLQMGKLHRTGWTGHHVRGWHLGKCADPELNARPYSGLAPLQWMTGAAGYLLNRAALRVLLWSSVQFADHVRGGLYEDLVVSELVERHGGRLLRWDTSAALGTVADY